MRNMPRKIVAIGLLTWFFIGSFACLAFESPVDDAVVYRADTTVVFASATTHVHQIPIHVQTKRPIGPLTPIKIHCKSASQNIHIPNPFIIYIDMFIRPPNEV